MISRLLLAAVNWHGFIIINFNVHYHGTPIPVIILTFLIPQLLLMLHTLTRDN